MAEQDAEAILRQFNRQVRMLEKLTDQALIQYRKANLTRYSTDALFNSALLSLHLRFELFLENLFYSCITESSGISDCLPEVRFQNRDQAEQIFFGHLEFPVWMPYEKGAEKVASRAFVDGYPFTRLMGHTDERKFLEDFSSIRNAIAHQSKSALDKVEHLTKGMPAGRRTPAGFLQSSHQGTTQFKSYCSAILIIASALTKPDIAAAKSILSLEGEYQKKQKTKTGGKFQCVTCGFRKVIRSKNTEIGNCSRCKQKGNPTKTWRRVY